MSDLPQRARDMRHAIDMMEGALMRWPELTELPERWGEPWRADHIRLIIPATVIQVRDVCRALAELTRIINSDEYVIRE